VCATCAAAVLLVVALGGARLAAAASRPGARVTVALFGDSVTEGVLVPTYLRTGLAPQLADDEQQFGYVPGGVGLIAAAPFRWHFNRSVSIGTGPVPANGWVTVGSGLSVGLDGPSGYSAVTGSPSATATVEVSDPDVQVLYSSSDLHCPFDVTAAGRTWTIDSFLPGPPIDTETSIKLPAGSHQLTVHGPSCGLLFFNGIVAQRPVAPGTVQVEVDNLGHSGILPSIDFSPRVQASLQEQAYSISVFLYGYIEELVGNSKPFSAVYLNVMTARAEIARAHDGACLVVQPTPIQVPASSVTVVARLDRTVAARAGCTYTTVLAHLWSNAAVAVRRGLLLVDGIHPTAAGYKLMAQALAPVITKIVHAQLQHQSATS
jgi:hypothetical protein